MALLLVTCCGCSTAQPQPKSAADGAHSFDALVDIGGRALHVHCVGEGAPLVVLDAGLGNDGSIWKAVQGDVGRSARTCAYDRLGLGSSSPARRA